MMKKYINSREDNIEPHLYSKIESCLKKAKNQSILFFGYSNSGKTTNFIETIKFITETKNGKNIGKKILDAITILNSFGVSNKSTRYVLNYVIIGNAFGGLF
jgi:myosin heavy subunit